MNKIFKTITLSFSLLIVLILSFIGYYIVLFNVVLALFFSFINIYIWDKYRYMLKVMNDSILLDFQVNTFIKNVSINCLTNDFNILEAMERTISFLDGEFKTDITNTTSDIKLNYNYKKSLTILEKKYKDHRALMGFIKYLNIVKEQSNVEKTARKCFEQSSTDSKNLIVYRDKILKIKISQLNSYFVNTAIGYFVIILVILSLNTYYIEFAKSISGIIINSITIIISMYISLVLINNMTKEFYE